METGAGRWWAPVASGAAVAALTLGMAAVGGGPGAASHADRSHPVRQVAHLPVVDFSGVSREPTTRRRAVPAPGLVAIDGFIVRGRWVTLRYTISTRRCSGRIEPPTVVESVQAVTVALHRRRPGSPDLRCPELTLSDSVRIRLAAPLGRREVRDGARHGVLVPEQWR